MATEALELLVRANLVAAVAALLILALRVPVRRLAGARTAYALWAVLPLAILASLLPAGAPIPIVVPLPAELSTIAWSAEPSLHTQAASTPSLDPRILVVALWALGAAAAIAFTVWRHGRLIRSLGRLTRREDGVLQAQAQVGPAVLGAVTPRIIVPADFDARYAPNERALILAHERTHLAGGDAQANAAIVALQCLFWFNPLIHLAAHYARLDQELACDAAVLARQPGARRAYAEALLKSQLGQPQMALGCAWPARSIHPLKHRLQMMSKARPGTRRRLLGGAAVALVATGSAYAAWAAKPAEIVANVVAEIARIDPGEARRVGGQVVRIKFSAPLSEVTLMDADRQLWKVSARGKSGLALADWARVTPEIVVEGYLPRLGACAADPCLTRIGSAPAVVAAPAPVKAQPSATPRPAPATTVAAAAPASALPGLPDYAGDLAPDPRAPVRILGAVTKVEWRYPNTVLHMVSFPDGQRWQVASGPPSNLSRTGLSPDNLAGSQVMVRGYRPAQKDCDPACRVVGATVEFEDGEDHSLWGMEE